MKAAEYRALTARGMLEVTDFQPLVTDCATRLGWLWYHPNLPIRDKRGFPDLVLVHPRTGTVLFRELKSTRGRLSADQEKWLAALALGDANVGVWRPEDWMAGDIQSELRAGSGR